MKTLHAGILGLCLAIVWTIFSSVASAGPPFIPQESPTALIPPWFAFNIGCKLHDFFSYLAFVTTPPDAYVIDLATAYWSSEVAYALTKNKILDQVEKETAHNGSTVSCEKIAETLNLQAFVVCRYMSTGRYLHLLEKDEISKEYSLTPQGALLTDSGELRDFMLMINEETRFAWRATTTDLMKDGPQPNKNSGWEIAMGMDVWSYYAKHPGQGTQFDGAMVSLSPAVTGALLMDWTPPWEDAVFCDIGGGLGSLLAEVLNHYPKMTGMVFDQPNVASRAKDYLKSVGVAHRAEAIGGDFLDKELPSELSECDVFSLRFILHDWDDDSNVQILKNIRNVAKKSSKDSKKQVFVVDQILDTGAESFFEKSKSMMSINMIASCLYGARERSIQEHVELFEAAGYENVALGSGSATTHTPLRTIHSVIQVEF